MLASKSVKILIVDDSEAIRIAIKEILDATPYSCKYLESDNGYDAVKLFRDESPDIVFLDIYMPRVDGIQSLKAMLTLNKKAKIIMITAAANAKIVHVSSIERISFDCLSNSDSVFDIELFSSLR